MLKRVSKRFIVVVAFLTIAVVIFGTSGAYSYWAGTVIAPNEVTKNQTIQIGEWETFYTMEWTSGVTYYPGDIVYVVVNGEPVYYLVREQTNGTIPPGPNNSNWGHTSFNPTEHELEWNHAYSYYFGDIITYNGITYIAQGKTETRNKDNGSNANPFRPSSTSQYWRRVLTYNSNTSYVYSPPTPNDPTAIGVIHSVMYNNELYRVIKTTTPGILPTNTEYFQKIVEPIDYLYQP